MPSGRQHVLEAVQDALARRAEGPPAVVAFDLDGTLVVDRPRREYPPGDVADVRPDIAAVALRLIQDGHTLLVVTGRETEEDARRDTVRALTEALGAPPGPDILQRIVVSSGGQWSGTKTAITRKVEALRAYDAAVLVGDLDHLDGKAARAVGIPFVDVKAVQP